MHPAQVPELIARIALADPRVRRELSLIHI